MSMLHIIKRSMSNSTTRNLLRSERSGVKRNTGAFKSQLKSATTQHRTKDDRGRMIPNQNAPTETSAEQTSQSASNNNIAAGRLKRDSMQSADERAAEVNRIGGRIIRNDERNRVGGSIAVHTSATAMHRKTRINPDDMVVTNPSNLSIPILDLQTPEFAESSDGKTHSNEDEIKMENEQIAESSDGKTHENEDEIKIENEVQNDDKKSSGFRKVVVFLAGTSAGLACASFLI